LIALKTLKVALHPEQSIRHSLLKMPDHGSLRPRDRDRQHVTLPGRLPRITHLDRAKVRASFERRFTAERMAGDYLKIYELAASSESAQTPRLRGRGEVLTRSAQPAVELAPAAGTSAVRL
jgi:hypothetical protein